MCLPFFFGRRRAQVQGPLQPPAGAEPARVGLRRRWRICQRRQRRHPARLCVGHLRHDRHLLQPKQGVGLLLV